MSSSSSVSSPATSTNSADWDKVPEVTQESLTAFFQSTVGKIETYPEISLNKRTPDQLELADLKESVMHFNDSKYGLGLVFGVYDESSKTRHIEVLYQKDPDSHIRDDSVWYCRQISRLFRENIYQDGLPGPVHTACKCFQLEDERKKKERGLKAIQNGKNTASRRNAQRLRESDIEIIDKKMKKVVCNYFNPEFKERSNIVFVGSDGDENLKIFSQLFRLGSAVDGVSLIS